MDANPDAKEQTPQDQKGAPATSNDPQKGTLAQAKRWWRRFWGDNEAVITFDKLYSKEADKLGDPVDPDSLRVIRGIGGEPWVAFTPKDRFGVALSGGGIRSATFNLGLLQSLAQLGVLRHVHYLSTVSGGGYVGGFWTTWLHRQGDRPGIARFPLGNDQRGGERAEVRHLREFSRFLLPRVGLFETEFWAIVMTILSGLLPSLLAAVAVLVLIWWVWVCLLAGLLAGSEAVWKIRVVLGLMIGYFVISEIRWGWARKSEHNKTEVTGYSCGAAIGSFLMAIAWAMREMWLPKVDGTGFAALKQPGVAFLPAAAMGAVAVTLLLMRSLIARFPFTPSAVSRLVGIERAVTRFVGLTCSLLALATLWWLAGLLLEIPHGLGITGTGAAVSTGLFLWVREWLNEAPKKTRGGNLLRTVFGVLKRATPKVLAVVAWLLLFVLVGAGTQWSLRNTGTPHDWQFWLLPVGSLVALGLLAWLFDPARVGMHEFYRSRISRCYLGASNPEVGKVSGGEAARAAQNRYTSERPADDVTLGELRKADHKIQPLHLVCTAANDMSGDTLGTLYRGARSAVISIHGISLGDATAEYDELRFSAALTASAAAFNSQMGRISVNLGPAVTFLMSAFNFRLGLWVPHPTNQSRRRSLLPGLLFFAELLGRSRTDGKHLHLSDGDHFENYGLYELIRRHCRHIIVSDCGADPEVAFDDLANVLRRVREDFGVEIELDVSRLRPGANGLSNQHAVVGTIHYNGLGGMDKGTILFFKPVLTSDEPPDVLQYRTRNQAFPHESTGDQFYDEAQWESYRRLGEHTGRMVLGFLDRPEFKQTDAVDRMFRDARSRWHPAPERLNEEFVAMSERCAELEQNLASDGPVLLRSEFFAEAAELAALVKPDEAAADQKMTKELEEELEVLSFLLRSIQIMEDVWVSGDFEQFWSHPLNQGWMSYFHRWAATPSFRRWWPILAPLYSLGFREFVKERFAVGTADPEARQQNERAIVAAQLRLRDLTGDSRYQSCHAWRCFLQMCPQVESSLPGKRIFGYELQLLNREGVLSGPRILIGFVLVYELPANSDKREPPTPSIGRVAEWRADEFFVPLTLHGSGIVSRMLDAIIRYYDTANETTAAESARFVELRVHFGGSAQHTASSDTWKSQVLGPAARYERVRNIEFYKSRGFRYRRPENARTGAILLHLELRNEPSRSGS